MACDRLLERENPWADLFDPARKKIRGGLWDYVRENKDYPYYLVRDRFAGARGAVAARRASGRGQGDRPRRSESGGVPRRERRRRSVRSAVCTHMGCLVQWNGPNGPGTVPCHGSRFKPDGAVIAGPAESPLEIGIMGSIRGHCTEPVRATSSTSSTSTTRCSTTTRSSRISSAICVDAFGVEGEQRYWEIFEELWRELGYADYLGAFQRFRVEQPRDLHADPAALFLLHYPFADRVCFPARSTPSRRCGAARAGRHPVRWRRRVSTAQGGALGVAGSRRRRRPDLHPQRGRCSTTSSAGIPARRYVMVDDKLRILAAIKASGAIASRRCSFGRATTHTIRRRSQPYPPADLTVEAIGESSI